MQHCPYSTFFPRTRWCESFAETGDAISFGDPTARLVGIQESKGPTCRRYHIWLESGQNALRNHTGPRSRRGPAMPQGIRSCSGARRNRAPSPTRANKDQQESHQAAPRPIASTVSAPRRRWHSGILRRDRGHDRSAGHCAPIGS